MQMMAEQAAASHTTTDSGSASGYGTTSVSTTPPVHAGTPTPVHAGSTPPCVHAGSTPPPVHAGSTPPPVHAGSTPPPFHAGTSPAVHAGTPPPPHVPAAPDRAPDGDVSRHVPYAALQVEDILALPGHDSLCRLDPHKSANTYW
ncbi:unnamed protein product [Cochlearia groenlandica]